MIVRLFTAVTTNPTSFYQAENRQPAGCRFRFLIGNHSARECVDQAGFLGRERAHRAGLSLRARHDSHFLPVVAELLAAVQTNHVSARESSGFVAARRRVFTVIGKL